MELAYIFGVVWGCIYIRSVLGVHRDKSVLTGYGYPLFLWRRRYSYVDTALFYPNRISGVVQITNKD